VADFVLCFQAHQPFRLRRVTAFDSSERYFDDARNEAILRRIADRCYRPALALFAEMIDRHGAGLTMSITGTLVEQLRAFAPDVLDQLRALVASGRRAGLELLGETSHHSLASLLPGQTFEGQVLAHASMIDAEFGVRPRVFRNTELIYADAISQRVAAIRGARIEGGQFAGMLAEGAGRVLGGRSVAQLFRSATSPHPTGQRTLPVLVRDHEASDELAFRFSDPTLRANGPLTPRAWIESALARAAPLAHPLHVIAIDLETLGEHLPASTGIFEFFRSLPEALASASPPSAPHRLLTASQAIERHASRALPVWSCPEPTSWADQSRDLSVWLGNAMQRDAWASWSSLAPALERLREHADLASRAEQIAAVDRLIEDWHRVGTSDHFYYLSTKGFVTDAQGRGDDSLPPSSEAEAAVHQHFSPYDSPYEACVNLMNVLDDLHRRAAQLQA
jgi:alpha-amylase